MIKFEGLSFADCHTQNRVCNKKTVFLTCTRSDASTSDWILDSLTEEEKEKLYSVVGYRGADTGVEHGLEVRGKYKEKASEIRCNCQSVTGVKHDCLGLF